jgi:hypothetical protein
MSRHRDTPLFYDREERPQFERMIADLTRAKRDWDIPMLREYSRTMLKLVGSIAAAEADPSQVPYCVLKWPEI